MNYYVMTVSGDDRGWTYDIIGRAMARPAATLRRSISGTFNTRRRTYR